MRSVKLSVLTMLKLLLFFSYLSPHVFAGEDLVFIGPGGGFGSFLKPFVIDFHSDDPVDCDIPHFPLYADDPELNTAQGMVGGVIDGKVTLCGGWFYGPWDCFNDGSAHNSHGSNYCYSLDPSTKTWKPFPNLLKEGADSDSVILDDGRWWIIGGFNGNNDYLYDDSTEMLTDGSWLPGPTLPMAMAAHCAAPLGHKYTLMAGGYHGIGRNKTWLYDWQNEEFMEVMNLPLPSEHHSCVALDEENVMMAGGYSYSAGHGTLNSVSIFNIDTLAWTPVQPLPEPNRDLTLVRDGADVLAIGGFSNGTIYRYQTGSGWKKEKKTLAFRIYDFPAFAVTRTMIGC